MLPRPSSFYFTGGVVRDWLLGRATHDLDVTVPGNASELARAFADSLGAAFYVMDESHDVARVILDLDGTREVVDFAHLRGASIQEDLATRDFTVNAMAADALAWHGEPAAVIDPFGGLADLAARQLRVVSPAAFQRDPVRLLRVLRFEAELDFALEAVSESLVRRDAPLIADAPGERVRDEFVRILAAPDSLRRLRRFDDLGLLDNLLPELVPLREATQSPPHVYPVLEHSFHAVAAAEETEEAGYMNLAGGEFGEQLRSHFAQATSGGRTRRELLRLTLLLHDIGKPATRTVEPDGRIRFFGHDRVGAEMVKPVLRRLRLSDKEATLSETVIAHHLRPILLAQNGSVSNRAIYRYFRDTGAAGVDIAVHAWCDARATYGTTMPPAASDALQSVIGHLLDRYYNARALVVAPPSLIDGKDVMTQLRLPPGPHIGRLLEAVREAQAAGQVTTREQALEYLRENPPRAQ